MESTSGTPAAEDRKAALRIKRTGQSCITLFVVFAVLSGLFSFGKAPWSRSGDDQGGMLNFNFISLIGAGLGIYAILFLPAKLKTILRLPTAKKTLGLIGGIGLALHVPLSLFMPLNCGFGGTQPAGTGGRPALGQQGPEVWTIGGKTYQIASSYCLQMPEGLQYTLEHPFQFSPADGPMDDRRATEIALPMMKHAVESGCFKKMTIYKVGSGAVEPIRIGVVLVEQSANGKRGYRVALTVAEIQRRIAEDAKSPVTLPAGK